jgi:3-oxoacyl-[acyl-carrier protein] reductase
LLYLEYISNGISSVDILINNARFPFGKKIWFKNIHDISEVELMNNLQVDLICSFRITKEILKLMMKKRSGVIINITSTPAIFGHNCGYPYSIAEAGLISLTKHIASEYGQYNIRLYSVALGDVYTDTIRRSISRNELVKAKNENRMKRLSQPEEVGKSIVSLKGENFSFSTGNTIIIDGGKVII